MVALLILSVGVIGIISLFLDAKMQKNPESWHEIFYKEVVVALWMIVILICVLVVNLI